MSNLIRYLIYKKKTSDSDHQMSREMVTWMSRDVPPDVSLDVPLDPLILA